MLDTEPSTTSTSGSDTGEAGSPAPRRRRAASRPAGPPVPAAEASAPAAAASTASTDGDTPPEAPVAKKTTRKRAAKKTSAPQQAVEPDTAPAGPGTSAAETGTEAAAPAAKKTTRRRATKKSASPTEASGSADDASPNATLEAEPAGVPETAVDPAGGGAAAVTFAAPVLFQPPTEAPPSRRRRTKAAQVTSDDVEPDRVEAAGAAEDTEDTEEVAETEEGDGAARRRRRRGGRGRRGGRSREDGAAEDNEDATTDEDAEVVDPAGSRDDADGSPEAEEEDGAGTGTRRRRRRRRRGGGEGADGEEGDEPGTVVRVREPRSRSRSRDTGRESEDDDGVRSIKGSTRLEAKKQRRREGRDAGRRRPSIITEAEFLARREAVDRTMIVRQAGERTQIAVLEDDVLVEHYVSTASSAGLVGNVYLGKVQNVLPSMEAAFVDIGKGRNAVLYAGEVNWDAAGLDGQPRRIELALKSGDPVLVQVTKDPIGHKGARLTSQVSLAGRYLVLVPGGSMTGISRKLPDTERSRLKSILKKVVPEGAGVIVRTAAEGASEEELSRDVARLTAQWEDIEKKSAKGSSAPTMLYGEPDMTIRVVRDIFNEDFARLVVSGDDAWDTLEAYIGHVAPDLRERMSRWTDEQDVFTAHRVDEQLTKALDRKVWLPSGGYLVIDRTEAMIVVDVNTGKFTGQGGNLEETVTKNNLEAAEEIVRQLRLRDLGGIIVIDFIDMVLESNRDLVLRRLLECLGRDRTKHQVAEVTSLGLVQMTRKRVGQGLHEVFAEPCEACNGRGYHLHTDPVETKGGGGGNGERRGPAKGSPRRGRGAKADKPADAVGPTDTAPDGDTPAGDASTPAGDAATPAGDAATPAGDAVSV